MDHFGYLFAAYSIIFIAIFLYVAFIWRRQTLLQSELDALERRLDSLANSGLQKAPREDSRA